MSTKLNNLSELASILSDDKKSNEGVLHFFSTFKINQFLRVFETVKSKGVGVSTLLISLIIFRLKGESIPGSQRHPLSFLPKIDDNTFYRLMNNSNMNWRKLLMAFAKQFTAHVKEKGDQNSNVKCFVLDDTDIEKTGKTFEFISKIFSHVTKLYPFGYKMLLLSFWDGKSSISLDFSLHREKGKKGNYGLKPKELKNRFSKKRNSKFPANKRVKELDLNKNINAISMLKRAVKNGFIANYVLMDSWFVHDYVIKSIREIKDGVIHVLGMCKIDKRKYLVANKELNAKQLITKHERKRGKYSKKYKSHYIPIIADYKGVTVRLFLIRYHNSKKWTLLLTSDLPLSFVKAIEIYQIRWSIEVLFKECKQYLRLGNSQNTDFDGQIADVTLTLITHTILTLQKRFDSYETMGELFRETQRHLLKMTLWERLIKLFAEMILQLIEIIDVDPKEIMTKLMENGKNSQKLIAMLSVIVDVKDNNAEKAGKTAFAPVTAS